MVMAEYFRDGHVVALQESLRAAQRALAREQLLANGGPIANILDPDAYGRDKTRELALRDGFVGLTMVDRDRTLAKLAEMFGPETSFPYWEAFTGAPGAGDPRLRGGRRSRALAGRMAA